MTRHCWWCSRESINESCRGVSLVWRKGKAVRSGYGSRRSARYSIGHRTGSGGTSRGFPVSRISACQPKSVTGWSSARERGQAHHRVSFEGANTNWVMIEMVIPLMKNGILNRRTSRKPSLCCFPEEAGFATGTI